MQNINSGTMNCRQQKIFAIAGQRKNNRQQKLYLAAALQLSG